MNKVKVPDAEVPPRLWDFPLLRLPWLEGVVGALLVFATLSFMADDNAGAQFIAAFIWIPVLVVFTIMYLLTLKLHFRPVDDFGWDLLPLTAGLIGLVLFLADEKNLLGIYLMFTLPVSVSLLARRFIAYMRWKHGKGPALQPSLDEDKSSEA